MMIGEFDFGDTFLALEGVDPTMLEDVHIAKVGHLSVRTCDAVCDTDSVQHTITELFLLFQIL